MAQQFKASGIPLFKASGIPAMDPNCCCFQCNCTTPITALDECNECSDSDFPTSYNTPRDFQIDISGVLAGSACGGECAVATHPSFFNRSFLLAHCNDFIIDYECNYICSHGDDGFGGTYFFFEWNYIKVAMGSSAFGGLAHLVSEILGFSRAVGTDTSTICNSTMAANMAASSTNGGLGFAAIMLSRAVCDLSYYSAPPTFKRYKYDTTLCPPADCVNPILDIVGRCVGAGWSLTNNSPSSSWQDSCHAANDVTAATASAYTV